MQNIWIKLIGWRATILQGDPTVVDRWNWLKKYHQCGPKKTLDAGCGQGAYTMYCAKRGNYAVGISFDQAQLKTAYARSKLLKLSNLEFHIVDLRHLSESKIQCCVYDQIILFETLEHIYDDEKVLTNLSNLLCPGGILLITVPFIDHKPLYGEKVSEFEDGGHVRWGYSPGDINRLINKSGLEVIAQDFISGFASQKTASMQFYLRKYNTALAWLLTFPLRFFCFLDTPLTRFLHYPYLSLGVLARKR